MSQHVSGATDRLPEPVAASKSLRDFLFTYIFGVLISHYWIVPNGPGLGDISHDSSPPWRWVHSRNSHFRDVYHQFNPNVPVASIIRYPIELLDASYLTTLSERVTAPVFVGFAGKTLCNETQTLIEWMHQDIVSICDEVEDGTRYTIASLALQDQRCHSSEHYDFQDLHCSIRNASKRGRLLRSAQILQRDMKLDCTQIKRLLVNLSRDLGYFRLAVVSEMSEMAEEVRFLSNVFALLSRADPTIYGQPWRLLQHLSNGSSSDEARLVSRIPTTSLKDSDDPVTAVLLHVVRGSSLLASETGLVTIPKYQGRHIYGINTILELLVSRILPGARKFSRMIKEANSTEVPTMNSNGDDPCASQGISCSWSNGHIADRKIKGFDDGTDHLDFLRDLLMKLQSKLYPVRRVLHAWDDYVTKVSGSVTGGLPWHWSWHWESPGTHGQAHDYDANGPKMVRWYIHPASLASIGKDLDRAASVVENAMAHPQGFLLRRRNATWLESEMSMWSRERAFLRGRWEVQQSQKERASMTFWGYLWSLVG